MSLPSAVVNLVNRSINAHAHPQAEPDMTGQPEAESILPIHKHAVSTTDAIKQVGNAALQPHDEPFIKKKVLGKGGFGVVNLCERKDKVRRSVTHHLPQNYWREYQLARICSLFDSMCYWRGCAMANTPAILHLTPCPVHTCPSSDSTSHSLATPSQTALNSATPFPGSCPVQDVHDAVVHRTLLVTQTAQLFQPLSSPEHRSRPCGSLLQGSVILTRLVQHCPRPCCFPVSPESMQYQQQLQYQAACEPV